MLFVVQRVRNPPGQGTSPPEPVASLATGAATQPAKRRCARTWAMGHTATKTIPFRVPRGLNSSKATAVSACRWASRDRARRGVRPWHAARGRPSDPGGPRLSSIRVRCNGDPVTTLRRWHVRGTHAPSAKNSARIEVGHARGTTEARAEGVVGVGGPHRSVEAGERAGGPDPAEQRRSVWK